MAFKDKRCELWKHADNEDGTYGGKSEGELNGI